jgi:hypothetical protein
VLQKSITGMVLKPIGPPHVGFHGAGVNDTGSAIYFDVVLASLYGIVGKLELSRVAGQPPAAALARFNPAFITSVKSGGSIPSGPCPGV